MPSLSKYRITTPNDPNEFEQLVADYYERKYQARTSLFGRNGQEQHGIDIIAIMPDHSLVGIQCKDYNKTKITKKFLKDCVDLIDNNTFTLSCFVIALARDLDASLQEQVYQLSQGRQSNSKCCVELLFWNDIERFLKLDSDLLRTYYPELYLNLSRYFSVQENLGREQYSHLIMEEKTVGLRFMNAFNDCHVKLMLEVDPFAGFPFDLVTDSDIFEAYISRLLDEAIPVQNTNICKDISAFLSAFKDFTTKIAIPSEFVNEKYAIARREYVQDIDTYKQDLEGLREKAVGQLRQITAFVSSNVATKN